MNAKKITPASTTRLPAKVAATLTTGNHPTTNKGESKNKTQVEEAGLFAEPSTAAVHDLVGVAVLAITPELRMLLGDTDLLSNALELQSQEIQVIVRERGVVAYVHLPIIVKEMERPATDLHSGMVLHEITGLQSTAALEESKVRGTRKAHKSGKPSGKAGRRA